MTIEAPENDTRVRVRFQKHQWLAVSADEPEVALVTGLGGGKTWTGARWIIGRAMKFPTSIHLATVNSYSQAQDLVIPALTTACDEMGLSYEWTGGKNLPTLFIDLGDVRAEIRVRSTEKFQRLRGPEYGSWWADEIRDAKRGSVEVVLGRLRCKRVDKPRYLWTTTPNAHDAYIYRRHRKDAKLVSTKTVKRRGGAFEIGVYRDPHGRLLVNCDTRANAHVREGYAEKLAEVLDANTLEQERGGGFVAIGNRVYHSFDRRFNLSALATFVPSDPLFIAMDFNVDFCAAVLIQERVIEGRMRSLAVGEIIVRGGEGTPGVIRVFKAKFGRRPGDGRLFLPGGLTIVGDANGNARRSNGGKSDYAQWTEEVDCILRVPKANGAISDRINAFNARLCNAKGDRDFLVNPDCEHLINDLESVVWSESKREPDKDRDPELTHPSDAAGYFVVALHPIRIHLDTARLAQGDRNLWRSEWKP